MSIDQGNVPDDATPSSGRSIDPTTELGVPAEPPAEATSDDRPIAFIRESWLQPSGWAAERGSGRRGSDSDTDPLQVIMYNPLRFRGWRRRLATALVVAVVGVVSVLAYVSVHNARLAAEWHRRDVAQIALTQKANADLAKANSHITVLTGTVGTLQGQLTTATTKAKANSGVGGALRRLLWPFG